MTEARNPYSPPMAPVADPSTPLLDAGSLIENGRQVPIGHCKRWIGDSIELFFQRPWKWIGTMLLLLVLSIVPLMVPYSNILTTLLYPVVAGGIAYALDSQRRTRNFTLNDVFAGFGPRFLSLAAIGCVTLLTYVVMYAVFYVMAGSEAALAIAFNGKQPDETPPGFWSALTLTFALSIPLTAATYLAAPLIMLHGASPVQAMKMSFFACVKNILPWTLCFVLMVLIVVLSAIPLLLGLFVTLPVAFMTFYSMYRDVFFEE